MALLQEDLAPRLCFGFELGSATQVEICDYHQDYL